MAKSARSKTRKHWASERRRTLGVPVETKQLEEQARRLKESLEKQSMQPSILRLKAVFKRPQPAGFTAQQRRSGGAPRAKAAPKSTPTKPEAAKPAAMETAAPEGGQKEEEVVVEMEVDAKKVKGRKPRTASRTKKTGSRFAAKKQKGTGPKK